MDLGRQGPFLLEFVAKQSQTTLKLFKKVCLVQVLHLKDQEIRPELKNTRVLLRFMLVYESRAHFFPPLFVSLPDGVALGAVDRPVSGLGDLEFGEAGGECDGSHAAG